MFYQSEINHSSKNTLDSSSLQNLVADLDEVNEESLSGGTTITPQEEIGVITKSPLNALVLLFANPFA